MTVYTKRGDKGETSLFSDKFGSKTVSKDSVRISAIGAVDEVNSYLGVVITFSENGKLDKELEVVQNNLFTVGSVLAGSDLKFSKTKSTSLEKQIDKMEKELPPLKNFILPGGTRLAGLLHFARSLARRAERRVVALSTIEEVNSNILVYLNRLSDYLFTLARYENFRLGVSEKTWNG